MQSKVYACAAHSHMANFNGGTQVSSNSAIAVGQKSASELFITQFEDILINTGLCK